MGDRIGRKLGEGITRLQWHRCGGTRSRCRGCHCCPTLSAPSRRQPPPCRTLRRNSGVATLVSVTASRFGLTTIIPRIGSWLSVPSNSYAVPLKCCPLHENLLAALRILRGGVAPTRASGFRERAIRSS